MFVTIERNIFDGKDYIRFCSEKECITIELTDRKLISVPFPGGRIDDECLYELFNFFKENIMPLVKGKKAKSKKGFSENVSREMHEGKKQSQAVAIAYSEARRGKKKAKKK